MYRERAYSCVILDRAGHSIGSRVIHAFTDQSAVELALYLCAYLQGDRAELLRGGVRVPVHVEEDIEHVATSGTADDLHRAPMTHASAP